MNERELLRLKKKSLWLRNKVLEMAVNAGAGHIAPSFSCIDILTSLYYSGNLNIQPKNPKYSKRDRFILSKGQAAVALYAVLADKGFFPVKDLMTFNQKGSILGGHPEDNVPGIEAFTGSLGLGLSLAAGIALAGKINKKDYFSFVLLGDGECHEGSVWEAAMFAAQHKLQRLIAIVDHNGLSATGVLADYLDVVPLEEKFASFGWDVATFNGHSFQEMVPLLKKAKKRKSKRPLVMIARTVKGKGVSFMENNPIWHYRIPIGKELAKAKKELI